MLIAILIAFSAVALTVIIHYEALFFLARRSPVKTFAPRYRILAGIFVIIIAHIVEICLFASAYYIMLHSNGFGSLAGNVTGETVQSFFDCAYFSFTTYTTLGLGDIEPSGYLRLMTGLESLTGLVMITWSASFLFLEMQKYWPKK